MKLVLLFILAISTPILKNVNCQGGPLDNAKIVMNFYDKEQNQNANLSCNVNLVFKSNACNVNSKAFSSGNIVIKLIDNPGQDAEDLVVKKLKKMRKSENGSESKDDLEEDETMTMLEKVSKFVHVGIKNTAQAMTTMVTNIGKAFRFKFLNNSENNAEFGQNADKCKQAILGVSYINKLDTRLIQNCDITTEGNPSGGFSIKMTLISRESEADKTSSLEFVIPNDKTISKDVIDSYVASIKTTCADSAKNIKDLLSTLETNYCKKKLRKKSFESCDQIQADAWKTKCKAMTTDLEKSKTDALHINEKITKLEVETSDCVRDHLNSVNNKSLNENVLKSEKVQSNDMSKQIKDLQTKIALDTEKKKKLSDQVLTLKGQHETLSTGLNELQNDVKLGDKIVAAAVTEDKSKTNINDAVSSEAGAIDAEIIKLKSDEKLKQQEIQLITTFLQNQTKCKDEASDKMSSSSLDITDLQSKLSNSKAKIAQLQSSIQALTGTNQAITSKIENSLTNKNDVSVEFSDSMKVTSNACHTSLQNLPKTLKTAVKDICSAVANGDSEALNKLKLIIKNIS